MSRKKRISKTERKAILKQLWALVAAVTFALLDGKLDDEEIVKITREAQEFGETFGKAWKEDE